MLSNLIPLFASYFDGGIFEYILAPMIALAFVATVPVIVRQIFLGR